MSDVLNGDDPTREGNLTAAEYEATYAEGGPCHEYPAGLIDSLVAELDADRG